MKLGLLPIGALKLFLLSALLPCLANCQEKEESIGYGQQYLNFGSDDFSKYLSHSCKVQQHLLCKLKRQKCSAGVFTNYNTMYGFSLQGGYERIFRTLNISYLSIDSGTAGSSNRIVKWSISKDVFGGQEQAAFVGNMKRYRISSKIHGTFWQAASVKTLNSSLWLEKELLRQVMAYSITTFTVNKRIKKYL